MNFNPKFKTFLLFLFIFLGCFSFGKIKADSNDATSGWAWSENIGWISFNCYNDYDGNGSLESHCIDMGYSSDYGVDIDGTGWFSGYAWSENIGWIAFEPSYVSGCPSGTCQARLESSTNEVSGWARVLSAGGGWDGWISLNYKNCDQDGNNYIDVACGGDNTTTPVIEYNIYRNTSTNELEGWAWSEGVAGWISFNCYNDYNGDGFPESHCTDMGYASDYAITLFGGDTNPPAVSVIATPWQVEFTWQNTCR